MTIKTRLVAIVVFGLSALNTGCSSGEPFDVAICKKDVRQVNALLERGADPNMIFELGPAKGFTPLTWALVPAPELCSRLGGNIEVAMALVEHGADVNKKAITYGGSTPLMEASRTYDVEILKHLLKNGADPNLIDDKGQTAAMVVNAGLPESKEVLEILIEAGLDLTLVASDGQSALSRAKRLGRQEHIELIEGASKQRKNK